MTIRQARHQRQLTQSQLAQQCGIPQGRLSLIERAKLPLYDGWRNRIGAALGIDPTDLS